MVEKEDGDGESADEGDGESTPRVEEKLQAMIDVSKVSKYTDNPGNLFSVPTLYCFRSRSKPEWPMF